MRWTHSLHVAGLVLVVTAVTATAQLPIKAVEQRRITSGT